MLNDAPIDAVGILADGTTILPAAHLRANAYDAAHRLGGIHQAAGRELYARRVITYQPE